MKSRSLTTGAISGLLISLAALYPAISLILPLLLPGFQRPIRGELGSELLHGALLMVSVVISFPFIIGFGALAARRTDAGSLQAGLKAGSLAGIASGIMIYLILVSPLNALAAHGEVRGYKPSPAEPFPDSASLEAYVKVLLGDGDTWLLITLLVMLVIGALSGLVYSRYHRRLVPPPPKTLPGLLRAGLHPRKFFAGDETPMRLALLVGAVMGTLYGLIFVGDFYIAFVEEIPELAEAFRSGLPGGSIVSGPITRAMPVLSPLGILGFFGFGGLIVLLLKDPPSRFTSRVGAVVLASAAVFTALLLLGIRIFYFHLGLGSFYLYKMLQDSDHSAIWDIFGQSMRQVLVVISNSSSTMSDGIVIAAFILPWLMLVTLLPLILLFGLGQGIFYAVVIPFFRPSPVDRAAAIQQQVRREPAELLPMLYRLFGQSSQAYSVLAHLVVQTYDRMPAVTALVSSLYTLGTDESAEVKLAATQEIHQVLAAHPEWRWARDMGGVYQVLDEVLSARAMYHILAIRPLPEQHTSSLPPLIVKGMKYLGRVIAEFHKIDRVEDMPSKLIFLENSLEAIHVTQRFVNGDMTGEKSGCMSTLPEQPVLEAAMDHWQGLVLTAIKHLKGRADLNCEMLSRQYTSATEVPFVCQVANRGLNVAQQVRLQVLPGDGYQLISSDPAQIEILPPGEERVLTIPLSPLNNSRRLRVAWEVTYDDAVDANRQLSFADVIEFSEPDKPFERIFPIPYVTGTPLKTDDVFVGREDVFDFIRENLLGAHQNNVIILHGQRRTGKTSVLYRLGRAMTDTHYGVLIDMQGKPARGEVDFLYSIADDIVFALEDHNLFAELPPRSAFEEMPEFFFRSRFLRTLYSYLDGKNLLLMFDEFEELQRRVEDGRLQPEIFQFLRNLMQHEDRVDFIFSGTHKLEELGAEYWSVLFNIAVYKPITFLSPTEVKRLIDEPVAGYSVEYDPLAVERIIEVAAGHPYFTQLVLHEMIVYHNEKERSYLTVTDVDRVLERIVERGEAHFKYIWAESTGAEHEVLKGMAEMLVGADAVNVQDLRDYLSDRGCHSDDDWQQALGGLEGRDILTRSSAKSPLYRFKVDLIRLWVDQTRPAL